MENVLKQVIPQKLFPLREASQVAAARRGGNDLGTSLGFDETQAGRLALVITEAATNILKHAQEGQILLRGLEDGGVRGVEVLALDNGPGIVNFSASQADGVSTTGTAGTGLGAMHRLADAFDIHTAAGKGTAIYMTVWAQAGYRPGAAYECGAVQVAIAGEDVCGDDWGLHVDGQSITVMVADGLGHGPEAHLASRGATDVLPGHPGQAPARLLDLAHGALRGTRGAAVAVASASALTGKLLFAGVGNIAACLYPAGALPDARRQLMSHNGIVGHNMRKVQQFELPWQPGSFLILASDGLTTQWNLDQYPGLVHCHPALIAGVLFRDFFRKRDDVTVLVLRQLEVRG
jgi:anti-sigma regulatory factor (Ser/Thr protein kinase)